MPNNRTWDFESVISSQSERVAPLLCSESKNNLLVVSNGEKIQIRWKNLCAKRFATIVIYYNGDIGSGQYTGGLLLPMFVFVISDVNRTHFNKLISDANETCVFWTSV